MNAVSAGLGRAAEVIAAAESIVAIGHVNPDGDALGSALAIAIEARADGKKAWATFGEPFSLGDQFRYLDLDTVVPMAAVPTSIDVVVACDTANPERLGTALTLAERAQTVVVVDHHVSNAGFGDIVVVDPSAAATAQLVYRLIVDHLGWPLGVSAATALYTGLVTDTGRFQYSATTPDVHRVAAGLLSAGVDPDHVGRHIYGEAPFGYLRVAGAVLSRARLEPDQKLVWSVIRQSDLDEARVSYEDTDGLIDLVRLASEAEAACLLRETAPGVLKGSLRSRGRIDVNAVAGHFGGGGHHNAAGFTAEASVDEVVAQIKDLLS